VNYGYHAFRAIHMEIQPHEFAVAWTTACSEGENMGGNFFNSVYRIRVESAQDTLVVWKPKHWHGTSLQNFDPKEKVLGFLQQGMAFATSNRLPAIWKKYQQREISAAKAMKKLMEIGDEIYA
jgi:hypothetical protein